MGLKPGDKVRIKNNDHVISEVRGLPAIVMQHATHVKDDVMVRIFDNKGLVVKGKYSDDWHADIRYLEPRND